MDPNILNNVGTGLGVFGHLWGAFGDLAAGRDAHRAASFEAEQLRQNAGQAQAASQRVAITADEQSKLVASRALAVAAAGGGGASDPTVVNLIAGIAQEGAYRQALSLYQGDERARQLQTQADATEAGGAAAEAAGVRSAIGKTIGAGAAAIKGIARGKSLLEKYGAGGPTMGDDISGSMRGLA